MTSPKISWSPCASSASQRSNSGWYLISTYELYHICASAHAGPDGLELARYFRIGGVHDPYSRRHGSSFTWFFA